MSFIKKLVVNHSPEIEALLKSCNLQTSIYGQHNYSGTMVCCDDEADFCNLNDDEEYAEKRIIETTTNF